MLDFIKTFFIAILNIVLPADDTPVQEYPVREVAITYSVPKQELVSTGTVSKHRCQFSWYCDGLSDRPREPSTWQNALEVARYSYFAWTYGYDITEGSTNYHSSKVKPKWRNDRGMSYVKTVHDHHFYHWNTDTSVASDTESLYNSSVALKGI